MENARLIKALEKQGFYLEFPDYDAKEELIIDILKSKNPRIISSLPLFFSENFDYHKIISNINSTEKKEIDKAILIAHRIYSSKKIENTLNIIIKENNIKEKFSKQEFNYYSDLFNESLLNKEKESEKNIEKQAELRLNAGINKDMQVLFSPAKIRIMRKIFNHEKITNTELKYYYKSISNINKASLNPSLQNYLRIIERTKKIR